MRTMIIILGGFVLLAVSILAATRLGRGGAAPIGSAIAIFIAAWFVVTAVNMWFGVARAGYSFKEELPIFLLIFLLPAAAAVFVRWKLR
jgi:hypothetical protein